MLRNYFRIALRQLQQHRVYSAINVVGLAAGLACCLVILLFVRHELSYDRFNAHADRIYRVAQEQRFSGSVQQVAVVAGPIGPALVDDYPEVQAAVRVMTQTRTVRLDDDVFPDVTVNYTDPALFDVFSFELLRGDRAQALVEPGSIVLTQTLAHRLFGDADPMGQVVDVRGDDYRVTGVMADVPENAHFTFDAAASLSTLYADNPWIRDAWGTNAFWTYVLMQPGTDPAAFDAKMPGFITRHRGEETNEAISYYLQPLTDIHLYSHMVADNGGEGDISIVYIFSAIALFVLLIAGINYMNLATARATQRMREVGLRKVMGARRMQLVRQFLGESLLTTFVAVVLAVLVAWVSLPYFNDFLGKSLSLVQLGVWLPVVLVGFFVVAGLLAGAYPAFHLSRFHAASVLKGTLPPLSAGARFRKVLVVTQFAISIVLLVAMATAYRQLQYVQNKHLGFDKEHLVTVAVPGNRSRIAQAKRAFLDDRHVTAATLSERAVGGFFPQTTVHPEGAEPDDEVLLSYLFADADFVQTMGMEVVAGRDLSADMATDSTDALLINETAVGALGWTSPAEALGKTVASGEDAYHVVGVVRDFHFASLHQKIDPLVMIWKPANVRWLTMRLRGGDVDETMASLGQTWKRLFPTDVFDYSFVDQRLDRLYRSDRKVGQLFGMFAGLAVVIACLGLLGLAAYTAERRVKEIGVRKVLGASAVGIVVLLSKDFARLVLVAFVVAAPVAYFAMNRWLDAFAYRVAVSWWIFALAGAGALAIALLTVSYQSLRAALADPVHSLRYE